MRRVIISLFLVLTAVQFTACQSAVRAERPRSVASAEQHTSRTVSCMAVCKRVDTLCGYSSPNCLANCENGMVDAERSCVLNVNQCQAIDSCAGRR